MHSRSARRDFGDDQRLPQPAISAYAGPRTSLLQGVLQIDAREADGRQQAEKDSSEEGHRQGKKEDGAIDLDCAHARQRIGGGNQTEHGAEAPLGDSEAAERACGGQ